jgi:hypothetical protein
MNTYTKCIYTEHAHINDQHVLYAFYALGFIFRNQGPLLKVCTHHKCTYYTYTQTYIHTYTCYRPARLPFYAFHVLGLFSTTKNCCYDPRGVVYSGRGNQRLSMPCYLALNWGRSHESLEAAAARFVPDSADDRLPFSVFFGTNQQHLKPFIIYDLPLYHKLCWCVACVSVCVRLFL